MTMDQYKAGNYYPGYTLVPVGTVTLTGTNHIEGFYVYDVNPDGTWGQMYELISNTDPYFSSGTGTDSSGGGTGGTGGASPSPSPEPSNTPSPAASLLPSPTPTESASADPDPVPSFSPVPLDFILIKPRPNVQFATLYPSGDFENLELAREQQLLKTAMANDRTARGAVTLSGAALISVMGAPLAAEGFAYGIIIGRVLFTARTPQAIANFQASAASSTVAAAVYSHGETIHVVTEFTDALIGAGAAPRPLNPVWSIKNDWVRGREVETMIEGIDGRTLHADFPVIDRFKDGIATSIKSMHLDLPTYQKMYEIRSALKGYINSVAQFNGASYGGDRVLASQIKGRALELVVPHLNNPAQVRVIEEMAAYANSLGVTFTVKVL